LQQCFALPKQQKRAPSEILVACVASPAKHIAVFGPPFAAGLFIQSEEQDYQMNASLETLFPDLNHTEDSIVTALNHQDIVVALSAALKTQNVAVLHMLYPRTDARTHSSLDELVSRLNSHGLHKVAGLVANEAHYLVFKEPVKPSRKSATTRSRSACICTITVWSAKRPSARSTLTRIARLSAGLAELAG
jgi:hypothetical protein